MSELSPGEVAAPGPRTVLLGTAVTVAQLQHCLHVARPAPQVLGCLLPPGAAAVSPLGPLPPVLGDFAALARVLKGQRPDLVLVSLPLALAEQVQPALEVLGRSSVAWRWMPALADQLAGRTNLDLGPAPGTAAGPAGRLWAIDPVQLLDRHPHPLDEASIRRTITGKVVLITGSGGSIGSELARMVCRFNPAKLVLVERAENSLFDIDRHLARQFPKQKRAAVLHDVTDAPRTLGVITAYRPDVIFHAAAHKHVPMMEEHPAAAVENNFYGTRAIADAAAKVGVGRFVMISSDKAVNPSSVMGATKRLAELYIQYLGQRCDTVFAMVRFGNVLGSACSVLPIWAEQVAQGGPLTVTHPEMSRYFMTIPEAAGLVVQSAALAGGEPAVFLLDMGRPIRILDLARRFVRAQGLEPDLDLAIQFTGVRPGEKLFEELAYDSEDLLPTPHQSVRIWRTTPPDARRMQRIIARFDQLRGRADAARGEHLWQHADRDTLLAALHEAVPEMVTPAVAETRS